MTDTSVNALQVLVVEVETFAAPLLRAARAPDPLTALQRFLAFAGWRITGTLDPQPIIDGIEALSDAIIAAMDGVDPADMAAFVSAAEAMGDLVAAVTGIVDLIAAGGPAPPSPTEAAAFGEDVLQALAVTWLEHKPVIGEMARFLGLIERVTLPTAQLGGWLTRAGGSAERVRPAALLALLRDPPDYIKNRVVPNNWATSADAATTNLLLAQWLDPLFRRFDGRWQVHADVLASADAFRSKGRLGLIDLRLPLEDDSSTVGVEYEVFSAQDANSSGAFGPAVELAPFGTYSHSFDVGSWTLDATASIALGGAGPGDSRPILRFSSAGVTAEPSLDVDLNVAAKRKGSTLLGGRGTRLELGAITLGGAAGYRSGDWDGGFSILAKESRLILSAADLGAVIGAVANDFETTVEFSLGLAWSQQNGLTLAGGLALEVEVTEGIDIGGIIKMSPLTIRLEIDEDIALTAKTGLALNLGPVALNFGGLGMGLTLSFPQTGGNLGAADLALRVEPPTSIGVAVDAAVISGGGFLLLDPERGEYAGILELSFPALSLSLKAVGLFTTDLPDDAEGYAIALLVFTEFPAIQLGYGFTLNGVGGILGIQHGVSIAALQSGLRTGILDSLLFPENPVAQAQTVLANLRSAFPISPGSLTFGPALKIGWGQGILSLSLGVVLQLDNVIAPGAGDPRLSRIVLLGQLKIVLPPIEGVPELLKLLVDVLGYYDFGAQELGIDAVLRDSHVAGLPLTGSLVVRARFGDDPTFVLAVGGFHPRFTDLPAGIAPQNRVGFQLRYGPLTVQLLGYTAITSNSFQFGAEVSLIVREAGFGVDAYLGFDALLLFEPTLRFTFDFRVGAAVTWEGYDLASVRVQGTVTGPGNWQVSGSASFKVLCFEANINFSESWGTASVLARVERAILPDVLAALQALDAWSARLPEGRAFATLRDSAPASGAGQPILSHPLGILEVRQKVMPFGLSVVRVGSVIPTDITRIDLQAVELGRRAVAIKPMQDHFARGDYFDLSDDQKLSTPSFERFDAGAILGSEAWRAPAAVSLEPDVETIYLNRPNLGSRDAMSGAFLAGQLRHGSLARSAQVAAGRLKGPKGAGFKLGAVPYTAVTQSVFSARNAGQNTGHIAGLTDMTVSQAEAARRLDPSLIVVETIEVLI